MLDQVITEAIDRPTALQRAIQRLKRAGRIALRHAIHHRKRELVVRRGDDLTCHLGGDTLRVVGQQLVQKRERIAHGTVGQACDPSQDAFLRADPFRVDDLLEMLGDRRGVDRPEVEALTPTLNRGGDLLRLRRGEDELDVRRRLLERLQQRVERPGAEHVHFVDDVDLESRAGRPEVRVAPQLADVVHAGVARGVDLHHVDILADRDGPARLALTARRRGRLVVRQAVERLGQNPGHRRLADTARAGEQVAVVHTPGGDGVLQRGGQCLLPDDLVEGVAPVGSGENTIRHSRLSSDARGNARAHPADARAFLTRG